MVRAYTRLSRQILLLGAAGICLQITLVAMQMFLNYLLIDKGYSDADIGGLLKYRSFAVMALALPYGLWIRGRALMPIFRFSLLLVPLTVAGVLLGAWHGNDLTIAVSLTMMRVASSCLQVGMVPFIMRNCEEDLRAEAIVIHFAGWNVGAIVVGPASYLYRRFVSWVMFDKYTDLLLFFGLASILAFLIVIFMSSKEKVPSYSGHFSFRGYDWKRIGTALTPVLLIGIGAGLTIQFLNLFFLTTFNLSGDRFALLAGLTSVIVLGASMLGPWLKRRFSFRTAITLPQMGGVIALTALALTSRWPESGLAFALAIVFFVIRQPLMNMANPITSEWTMEYVGERNREMTSALRTASWSGAWGISAVVFEIMRGAGLSYMVVLLTTAAIYAVAVTVYFVLVKRHEDETSLLREG